MIEAAFDVEEKPNITSAFSIPEAEAAKMQETESGQVMMITILIFLLLLGILGVVVEYTKCARKPNYASSEDSDDHLINHLYLQGEMDTAEDSQSPEQQAYFLADKQLVKSKTLWGILALSFSFSRNFKKLF